MWALCLVQPDLPPHSATEAITAPWASGILTLSLGHVPWPSDHLGHRGLQVLLRQLPWLRHMPPFSQSPFLPGALDVGLWWVPSFPPQGLAEASEGTALALHLAGGNGPWACHHTLRAL